MGAPPFEKLIPDMRTGRRSKEQHPEAKVVSQKRSFPRLAKPSSVGRDVATAPRRFASAWDHRQLPQTPDIGPSVQEIVLGQMSTREREALMFGRKTRAPHGTRM